MHASKGGFVANSGLSNQAAYGSTNPPRKVSWIEQLQAIYVAKRLG